MLSSSDVWYNINEANYRKLEQIAELLLKEIFDCSSQITLGMLYLDLLLMANEINYLVEKVNISSPNLATRREINTVV